MTAEPFPNYTQIRQPLPDGVWRAARVVTVAGALGLCALLVVDAGRGLDVFWGYLIPVLPLLWLVAPGVWRNVCPLAAVNQIPRTLGFTRGATAPDWFRTVAPYVGIALFLAAVFARPSVFNDSGAATAALIGGALVAAFTGGYLLKGKSGWCSSICPLLPVQRLYGQEPLALVPNNHCKPCVGCTKNCYDFNPRVAYLADVHDDDPRWSGARRIFAGAFPGLVVGFFGVPDPDVAGLALAVSASAGSFLVLEAVLGLSTAKVAALYGAAAINLFYWLGPDGLLVWPARVLVLALTVLWLRRTFAKEPAFLERAGAGAPSERVKLGSGARAAAARAGSNPEVTFSEGGERLVVSAGAVLLDVVEGHGKRIEAGCRMGVCGADPMAIVAGAENLSPVATDERDTLERLGLDPELNRMACCARVNGPVTVSLTPNREGGAPAHIDFPFDPDVRRVVVVGNGIAGVTAADHVRRRHPDCQVDVVAAEPHPLYNRMGISRLIYGRSAMVGLHLLPDAWYEDHRVTCWLNTRADAIDLAAREVRLATGERLGYDRLILATGSEAFVPQIPGFGGDGSFVLRTASDALEIREYVQRSGAKRAAVAGGGLLGLEAAYALHKLGLRTTVLERGPWLLRRQLDARAGELLRTYLANLGIEILLGAETAEVRRPEIVTELTLRDGRTLPVDVLLVAAGIAPAADLARRAGLATNRGVRVDDRLRTSDPHVFAVGDLVEWDGQVLGLWPAAVAQAEVAAENAVGGDRAYTGTIPVTMLKVVGVELLSLGQIAGEYEIALEDPEGLRYRKLVADATGRAVGAILLGYPQHAQAVTAAVRDGRNVSAEWEALRAGDWDVLAGAPAAAPAG